MDEDRAGTVREWNSRSVEGHAGLRGLADEEFSGVIETDRGTVRAFMTNGAVVGVDGAGIGDLDGRHMTAYAAPDDAIPLLFAMQERGGEPRAQYYTEETPLTEVDRTLEEGGFTGYVELSENVLSGDYYVVYHAGRSSSVAFVGSSSRLLTGDEAFERAADEVGIYDVVDVDVPVIDIPGDAAGGTGDAGAVAGGDTASSSDPPAGGTGDAADAAEPGGPGPAGDAGAGATDDAGDRGGPAPDDAGAGDDGGDGPATATDGPAGSDGRAADAGSAGGGPYGTGEEIRVGAGLGTDDESTGAAGDEDGSGGAAADALDGAGTDTADSATPGDRDDGATTDDTATGASDGELSESLDGTDAATAAERTDAPSSDAPRTADAEGDAAAPARPAADERDPAATADTTADAGTGDRDAGTTDAGTTDAGRSDRPAEGTDADDSAGGHAGPSGDRGGPAANARSDAGRDGASSGPDPDRLAAELRETREALERVRAERDDHRTDAERLRERVETLEARIEALEADGAAADAAAAADGPPGDDEGAPDESPVDDGPAPDASGPSLDVDEAFAGTNLFVRYESKAEPTLEAAQGGGADPAAVNRNLRLEHHTRFEAAGATVDGEPFESFLTSSFEYQFVEWVVRDLLYELRSTGNRMEMEQLYDAIPAIDRIHFHGEVQVGDGGATDANRFDVIFRDRMGGPLLVANLHESRDPTAAAAVTTLIEDARTVANAVGTVGAAFAVTTSYYEPPALEAAASATGGGFLSRSRKKSYVKLDRKRGFHLCLVEARDGEFNLKIPDL